MRPQSLYDNLMIRFCSKLTYEGPTEMNRRPYRGVPIGDKFLLCLYRVNTGAPLKYCAKTFSLTDETAATRIFTKMAAAWRQALEMICTCPRPEEIEQLAALDSDDADIRHLKILFDTTELAIQHTENLALGVRLLVGLRVRSHVSRCNCVQAETWSEYKSGHTAKALIGTLVTSGIVCVPPVATGGSKDSAYVEEHRSLQWAVQIMGLRPGLDSTALDKVCTAAVRLQHDPVCRSPSGIQDWTCSVRAQSSPAFLEGEGHRSGDC